MISVSAGWGTGSIVNCTLPWTAQLPTLESHQIAETVRHALFHALPTLQEVTVHVDRSTIRPAPPMP